jgi:uncharacterized membrane protein
MDLAKALPAALPTSPFIPAIIFLVVAPYNQSAKIRFHCWQSIFLGSALSLFALGVIGIHSHSRVADLFRRHAGAFHPVWIICVIKAFGGERFVIPLIGPFAAKQAGI